MILAPILRATGTPIVVTIFPTSFSRNVSGASGTTSSSATATISGGIAPYTITWTSGNVDIGAASATSLTTAFTYTNLGAIGEVGISTFTVTARDAAGTTESVNYSVVVTRTS